MRKPLGRFVSGAVLTTATLLVWTEHSSAQVLGPSPPATVLDSVGRWWNADPAPGLPDAGGLGSAVGRHPSRFNVPVKPAAAASVALPQLRWTTDGIITGAAALGAGIGQTFSVTRQPVPDQGLDPSNINWGLDRNIIGDPSTSANSASNVFAAVTLLGPPVFALLTQPGAHGFEQVVRRPIVLYGESLFLAQAITMLMKRSIDRPRPYVYLPASERPPNSNYDVNVDEAFLSMPSAHATFAFAAASYAATDDLLSRPGAGWGEHVAVASIGGFLAGFTGNLRIKADQHFPSDVLVGGLVGTASGVSVPLLHQYVSPGGKLAPHPGGHAWLWTVAGYVVGIGAGVGISSIAY